MCRKNLQYLCVQKHQLILWCKWLTSGLSLSPSLSSLRDLSMNNISKIQSRAFHRLHLLSELWVKLFTSIDRSPSKRLEHDKKQLFFEPLRSSMMGIDDFGLWLISPAKTQPAAIATRGSRDGWIQKGWEKKGELGWEPDSHSESKYMVP